MKKQIPKQSLWNLTKKKNHYIKEYINSIEPPETLNQKEKTKFEERKKKALKETESNTILKIIKYKGYISKQHKIRW